MPLSLSLYAKLLQSLSLSKKHSIIKKKEGTKSGDETGGGDGGIKMGRVGGVGDMQAARAWKWRAGGGSQDLLKKKKEA